MTITEKAAYIKGITKGLNLDKNHNETKIIYEMIELLDDMALKISELEEGFNDISDQLDSVDEDLYNLEEEFYECEYENFSENKGCCEITCPNCNKTICLSESNFNCCNCNENLETNSCNCDNLYDSSCDCSDHKE